MSAFRLFVSAIVTTPFSLQTKYTRGLHRGRTVRSHLQPELFLKRFLLPALLQDADLLDDIASPNLCDEIRALQ